jgi:hypothetical protein
VSRDAFSWTYQGVVLREQFHLSYPYVFRWNEEIFLIPLVFNDITVGVLELGSFKSFTENHLNWINEAARSISVVIHSIHTNLEKMT